MRQLESRFGHSVIHHNNGWPSPLALTEEPGVFALIQPVPKDLNLALPQTDPNCPPEGAPIERIAVPEVAPLQAEAKPVYFIDKDGNRQVKLQVEVKTTEPALVRAHIRQQKLVTTSGFSYEECHGQTTLSIILPMEKVRAGENLSVLVHGEKVQSHEKLPTQVVTVTLPSVWGMTEALLNQTQIGPEQTLAILQNIQHEAVEGRDLDYRRSKNLYEPHAEVLADEAMAAFRRGESYKGFTREGIIAEIKKACERDPKKQATYGRFFEKQELQEGQAVNPSNALHDSAIQEVALKDWMKKKLAKSEVEPNMNIADTDTLQYSQFLSSINRSTQQGVEKYLHPGWVAQMVGVSMEELLTSGKYDQIVDEAASMFPPIGNVYEAMTRQAIHGKYNFAYLNK